MQKQCFCIPKRVGLVLEAELPVTSYKLPVTNYKLQVTSYKSQVTNYKLQIISHKLQTISYKFGIQIIVFYRVSVSYEFCSVSFSYEVMSDKL